MAVQLVDQLGNLRGQKRRLGKGQVRGFRTKFVATVSLRRIIYAILQLIFGCYFPSSPIRLPNPMGEK